LLSGNPIQRRNNLGIIKVQLGLFERRLGGGHSG